MNTNNLESIQINFYESFKKEDISLTERHA
jgi:hypothetical protein